MTPAITSKDLPCLANDLPLQGTSGQSGNSPSHPVLPFLGAQHSFVPKKHWADVKIVLWSNMTPPQYGLYFCSPNHEFLCTIATCHGSPNSETEPLLGNWDGDCNSDCKNGGTVARI